MDFFTKTGKMAIGTRLRRLSERITHDAAQIYALYDVELQPRWFPVFYVLSQDRDMPVTAIAHEIGQTHASVSQILKEMRKAGIITEKSDPGDARKTLLTLSRKGKAIATKIDAQYCDVTAAVEALLDSATYDLWKSMEEMEHLLDQRSLLERVQEQRKLRMSSTIKVVPYERRYKSAFKELNEAWIRKYFKMEDADHKALDDPQNYILKNGGYIAIALDGNRTIGACALVKMDERTFELAKMAVSPDVQGKGVGYLLGKHMIGVARKLGAKKLYLESNTILKPAINLYYKLGFVKMTGRPSPYERSNIQMELTL